MPSQVKVLVGPRNLGRGRNSRALRPHPQGSPKRFGTILSLVGSTRGCSQGRWPPGREFVIHQWPPFTWRVFRRGPSWAPQNVARSEGPRGLSSRMVCFRWGTGSQAHPGEAVTYDGGPPDWNGGRRIRREGRAGSLGGPSREPKQGAPPGVSVVGVGCGGPGGLTRKHLGC